MAFQKFVGSRADKWQCCRGTAESQSLAAKLESSMSKMKHTQQWESKEEAFSTIQLC